MGSYIFKYIFCLLLPRLYYAFYQKMLEEASALDALYINDPERKLTLEHTHANNDTNIFIKFAVAYITLKDQPFSLPVKEKNK